MNERIITRWIAGYKTYHFLYTTDGYEMSFDFSTLGEVGQPYIPVFQEIIDEKALDLVTIDIDEAPWVVTIEQEIPEDEVPQEGDWVTEDHITFCQYQYPRAYENRFEVPVLTRFGKPVVDCFGAPERADWRRALKKRMDQAQFWPNVWCLSDHGNWHLLSLKPERRKL